MGVHGLWELLAPVGRRVSVETLAGKKLAIDASIWMVQFMKAMRDERGEMVRNAHLLGFFRRICKLLFLRTKPVFVFDGGTPALKRRTVIARRRQRENAQAKVRKTAEKLLLNHLKAMKLKEIADDIKNQREKQKNDVKGKKVSLDQDHAVGSVHGQNDVSSTNYNQEKLDEMLAASIMAEEGGSLANNSTLSATIPCEEDGDEDEEMILPYRQGEIDPTVLAALPPSWQCDIVAQKQRQHSEANGKKIMLDKVGSNSERDGMVLSSCNQEKLDEMLAASLMEEENRSLNNNASTSAAPYPVAEDGDMYESEDGDEEMILPAMDDDLDPSILASLPPSMQLDLLVQNRERLMAENRQKYQKVKKDPSKFSELQIQAYLKTVAFRREIDQVQKAASGRGVDGVQTSRIASEAGREFIFSSSFTGNKQELMSGGAEKSGDKQQAKEERDSSVMHASSSTSKSNTLNASTSKSNIGTASKPKESRKVFDDNIETYLDERGRIRVSRVRAMGIRMTRDLQRNLDLMKEIEQERENDTCLVRESNSAVASSFFAKNVSDASHDGAESVKLNGENEDSVLKNGASLEISFEDDGDMKCFQGNDDIFARLVAENPLEVSFDDITSKKLSSASDSDCDWEEGIIEAKDKRLSRDVDLKTKRTFAEDNNSDDSEVDWEEGDCETTQHTMPPRAQSEKINSKGALEEQSDLQEAITRSLEDLQDKKSSCKLLNDEKFEAPSENACKGNRFVDQIDTFGEPTFIGDNSNQKNRSTREISDGVQMLDVAGVLRISKITGSPGTPLKSSVARNSDDLSLLLDTPQEIETDSPDQPMKDISKMVNSSKEAFYAKSVTPSKAKEVNVAPEGLLCTSNEVGVFSASSKSCEEDNVCTSDFFHGGVPHSSLIDNQKTAFKAELPRPLVETTNPVFYLPEAVTNELIRDIEDKEKLAAKKSHGDCFQEIELSLGNSALKANEDLHVDVTEANLEEEINILGQERMDLGDEQRRLERTAESISGEMFTECQELLQMFGLPYIIAPMEAEAQCAYMELANLVDGVVTDDSDVFLFGGRSVYKNIFDDRKYVETYFMKDIEIELGLTREKLIRMALLLGSDYTEGVSGIGIVNAIEVVNAFPEEDGLHKFREWIESPDPTILGNFSAQKDSSARKKGSKKIGDNDSCSQSNVEEVSASHENKFVAQEQAQSADRIRDITRVFMDEHRKVSKNWHIPPSFPSEVVVSAYISPQVDKSTEPFTWGRPDHFVLRKLCWDKFGWGSQKADDLLLPVLKEYNKHETQLRLEAFYTFNERFAKIRSKRIKKAVKGITGNQSLELTDDAAQEVSRSKNKRKSRADEAGDDQLEKLPQGTEESAVRNQSNHSLKSTPKKSRKRKIPTDAAVSESPISSDGKQGNDRRSRLNGRCRGRGRGRTTRRRKGKGSPTVEVSEMSSSDDDDVEEVHMEKQEGPPELRRSMRMRKPVDYTANDLEINDLDQSADQVHKTCFDGESSEPDLFRGCQDGCENVPSGLGQEKEHNAQNLPRGEGLDEDSLEKGRGFCLDHDDNDRPGVCQRGDPCLEGELSEEYLKTGGGFCTDEGEHENSISDLAPAPVVQNDYLFICTGLGLTGACASEPTMDQATVTMSGDLSKLGTSLQENETDNTGTTPVGALRAMPLLRKKRRKS